MAEEKKVEICDDGSCLFCSAKCPECGATDVTVEYAPVYRFDNDTKNCLTISMFGGGINLECRACGASIGEITDDEPIQELTQLAKKMRDILMLPLNVDHESLPAGPDGLHGTETTSYEMVSTERAATEP